MPEAESGEPSFSINKYLLDRIKQLETLYAKLRSDYARLESEKRYIENERFRLEREVRRLRSELERLRSMPLIIGTLVEIVSDSKAIVKSSTGPTFLVSISQFVDREKLVPGCRVALNQQSLAIVDVLPPSKDPLVMAMEIEERPSVTYSDIGGLDEQIKELREIIELPLKNPELFERMGIDPPKGVLLYGPPGTGKTLLAKAIAHHTDATFIKIVGSELVQKYIGEGARLVREVFQLAREKAPSIIFIDEIDAIGARRLDSSTSGDREVQRTLMQLLAEMDGFSSTGNVKVIAATNRPDILDPALLRPGRFDRLIEVPLPDLKGRIEILKIHTRRMPLADDVDLEEIARRTEGASGADLKAITTEAGMFAIREGRDKVSMLDFERAIEKVLGKDLRKTRILGGKEENLGLMFG